MSNGRPRRTLHLDLQAPEWDPLFAYAQSQGISPPQAARELLLVSIASNVQDAAFLAAMRSARHQITKIAYQAGARAMRMAYDEVIAQAAAAGISIEGM